MSTCRRLIAGSMSGARDVTVILEPTRRFSVITPRMAPRKDDPYDCINMQQQPDIRIPRCVVSCRIPSRGPSDALLRAAANPMTVAEHVEAGTLRVGRRDPNVPAELYGDDRSDFSDLEDY